MAALANSTAPWDSRLSAPITRTPRNPPHNGFYYLQCMFGGVLSCGITHTAIVPLDIIKCKMQVFPDKYKNLVQGMKTILKEEGVAGLRLGWGPTLIGYSMQGLCKFGLYEVFKDVYSNCVGEENASKYKGLVWLASSASAEFFADIALCPMEMVKVKVQTSPTGAFPTSLSGGTLAMLNDRKTHRFPFGSLVPLWCRQIPYTMAKFYFFEKIVGFFYSSVLTKPRETYSSVTQLGVTFASGYLAGVICAIVSHPADSMVSQMGKAENKGKSFLTIGNEVGLMNLCTKGIGTRVLMIGTLTGLQWWIYDTYKTIVGFETSGGK